MRLTTKTLILIHYPATGATPEDGEKVEKATDVQLADETESGAAQEGGGVTHKVAAGKGKAGNMEDNCK